MIELYIENKKIDITDDLEINFTYESIDPNKLSSIKNSFSKTVNIPGTPNNNITFGHIFRYDKYIPVSGPSNIESYYDPHKKVSWFINNNGSLINRGYCTLDNIIVKDERNITYQLTLYGGIGEFFYALSYNDDGSPKTLKDLYWNWWPKVGLVGHGTQTTPGNENTKTLYTASAAIVAQSYHSLDPLYTYSGTTEIEKDIVFVPCYTGLYEDFDSKHMLVSTFNQNYTGNYLSSENRQTLQTSFPDTYTDSEGNTYNTLDKTFSSSGAYRYGLVTFSRDIDPWEAGDIRVSELPVAVRLSKLMNVISQAQNNGGYEVIWDSEILHSYEYLYSWILLGKLNQDRDDLNLLTFSPSQTHDGQISQVEVTYSTGISDLSESSQNYNIIDNATVEKNTYGFYLNVFPNFTINTDYSEFKKMSDIFGFISGCCENFHNKFEYIWNTPILIHKIYSGSNLIKTICDIFYFSTDPDMFYFGYNVNHIDDNYNNYIKTELQNKIIERFMNSGETIDQFKYHNCKLETPEVSQINDHLSKINYKCSSELISTNLTIGQDISDFKVEQIQGVMWTHWKYDQSLTHSSGLYGTDSLQYNTFDYTSFDYVILSKQGVYGFFMFSSDNTVSIKDYSNSSYSVDFSFNINEDKQNGLLLTKDSGFNIIKITKDILFANSDSPMKYLTGYCKLMNYRFICDNTRKKIYIKTLKNYYLDRTVDLDSRVDLGRNIEIKNITTSYKTINLGLETPETYPISLFNKISKSKFNTYKYDTGIKYNLPETSLLNDLCYKNVIDYQQSSIYYNTYHQLPRPYSTQSISWSLFNKDQANTDEIKKIEIFTPGTTSVSLNLLGKTDFLPKISLFDKDNKNVDVGASLIFLNGFVKNYDYTSVPQILPETIQPDSTNPTHYINASGTVATSQYQDIYIYNVLPNTTYYVTASFTSGYGSNTVNYYNSSGTIIGTEYPQASANLVDAPLTIPPDTATIRCNFRKADTNAKMRVIGPRFVISPRVCFSNDMVEQYYLNQSRCYMYDFKYNDNFVSWGCYSSDQKGTATSWVLPLFSRDLYNLYLYGRDVWWGAEYKLSSWNIINQKGLDSLYDLSDTLFISDPNYDYSRVVGSENYKMNEYSIYNFPLDEEPYTNRIYDKNWKDYLKDLYDRNTRDITAYVDLSGLGEANDIMRYFYSWKSHLWIITKIENFKISNTTNDKFTKVILHKIKDKNTWINN
jgi:hypothetical protein